MRIMLTTIIWLAVSSWSATAQPSVSVAVENQDYAPYYTWADGNLEGPCGEIVAAVFETMGYDVEFVPAPWSRVLRLVELQDVDAGLCATITEERLAYAIFPRVPLLSYDATLFVVEGSPIASAEEEALAGLTFGVVSGYSFAGVDVRLEEIGMVRQDAQSRESLLQILLAGRVDAVLDTRLPFLADARAMGAGDQIRVLEPTLMQTPAYLMFSSRDGAAGLAEEFSAALAAFRASDDYRLIAQRYGMSD